MLFCEDFDLTRPSVNPKLTRGILVIIVEKGILGALVSEQVATSFWMFLRPHGEKITFLDFSGFGTRIEGG